MKKLIAFALICSGFIGFDGVSATRATRANTNSVVRQPVASATTTSGARGRAAALTPAATQRVSARAATTQKAINTNTKIVAATANTVVDEECKTKYYGCMDSFCMLDNANGGRCLCSNRNAELDKVLAEIQKLDEQSYAMATSGVERINMGDSADAVQKMVDNITGSMDDSNKKTRARTLNLDAWNNVYETDEDDVFGTAGATDISNLTGDELQAAVMDLCVKQMPECSRDISMLKLMYAQQIKSDCAAYENSLKQQKAASAKKLQTAQTAMREAALEQYQNANKYDLGQCTIRFKQCMQTTADCGDDFSKCAAVVAADNAQTKVGKKNKVQNYTIKGAVSSITIAATTYDTLLAKKPMCESVTKQCVDVKDKVWDAFLREAAPALKSAELVAESNLRMNCIANISDCFQQACKDRIDPNDPDGSYDMCLSRPETMRSLCKVQIDPCVATEPKILDYVYARLASMRVDACTTEVKECLTDDNRCGKDYSQCIGLDTDAIINLCPSEKLTACNVDANGNTLSQAQVYVNIEHIISGILLNVDNSLLNTCVNLVNTKMLEICGDTAECLAFNNDSVIGADSLTSYKARDGSFVIDGILTFGNVKVREVTSTKDDVKFGKYELDISDYANNIRNVDGTSAVKERVLSTLQSTQNKINQKIALLTSDPKISMCVYGRDMTQIRGTKTNRNNGTEARFPNLLDSSIVTIINSGLDRASENYAKKYDEMVNQAMEEAGDEKKTALCSAMSQTGQSQKRISRIFDVVRKLKRNQGSVDVGTVDNQDSQLGLSGNGYEVRHVIDGMTMDELMAQSKSNTGSFVQTDKDGNMISQIITRAVYSADTNVCTLTTTTQVCKHMKDVYDTSSDSCGSGGLFSWGCDGGTFSILSGGGDSSSSSTFRGTVCTDLTEPVTKTEEIKM